MYPPPSVLFQRPILALSRCANVAASSHQVPNQLGAFSLVKRGIAPAPKPAADHEVPAIGGMRVLGHD
jgi:hypothetical protein